MIFTAADTPAGRPRPGVSNDQLRAAIKILKEVEKSQDEGIYSMRNMAPELKRVLEDLDHRWGS